MKQKGSRLKFQFPYNLLDDLRDYEEAQFISIK